MKFKSLTCIALSAVFFLSAQIGPAAAVYTGIEQNPFASMDKERAERLAEASGKYEPGAKTESIDKDKIQSSESDAGIGFIVKFRDTVSFREIKDMLESYNYKLIGNSANRLFSMKAASLEQIKTEFKDKVVYVEQDRVAKLQMTTNDPKLSEQWALNETKITNAWEISKGSPDVVVAMIDTGIYREHEDLASANIAAGWDFISKKPVDCDVYGHGTMTTGVIAATANNGIGISGACWNVKIIPYQVFGDNGGAEFSDVCDAIYAAVDAKSDIINMSLGSYYNSPAMSEAVANAVSKGCIVVAAAGNEYGPDYMYPASYDGVISCSSIDSNLEPSFFTSYNDKVDVASPGEDVLCVSADGVNKYESVDGTSFSSPYVAGIAALAKAEAEANGITLDSAGFQRILRATSVDMGAKGFDDYYGYGVVNAENVLKYVRDMKNKDFIVQNGVLADYLGAGGNITIPAGVTSIRSEAFSNCGTLESVSIPSGVTSIESKAFYQCKNLKDVTIPNSVTYIGHDAFGETPWLVDYPDDYVIEGNGILIQYNGIGTVIKIPSNVKSIGEYAFAANYNIKSVLIPGSVTSIGEFAFYGYHKNGDLSSLTSVTVPSSVTSIGYGAFAGTPWLTNSPGDFLVAGNQILIHYNGTGGSITIPENIKSINAGAFEGCQGLNSVVMHRGVTGIGDSAFEDCEDLTSVTVSGSVSNIGKNAFAYCVSLEDIIIPANVIKIGEKAFDYCSRVEFTCAPGSAAATFAKDNRIPIVELVSIDKLFLNTNNLVWVLGKSGRFLVSAEPGYATNIAVGWISSNTKVATVDSAGKIQTVGFGTAVLTCTADDGSGAKVSCKITVIPATPESLTARSASYNSITLKWNPVKGADAYAVYRYSPISEKYDLIKSVTGTSFTNTGLKTDKMYYYKVKAYKKAGDVKIYSGYTATVSSKPLLTAPDSFKAAKTGNTSIKLSWSPVSGADGYVIYRYSQADEKYLTLTTISSTAFTNSPLKSSNDYYYKVRAYRIINGVKIFGAFSLIKHAAL